ncbi:MAG: DUF835 domain-containing protein [Thermococcus sp.]|uniref:DUF835 domain-containing protein n=1 Tax=Thermococcus sp. TaxID=35749 RepID=UPI001D93D6F8|nr:DUF835 domain-containing protein [Thermococcus sp.]MBO8174554.1 DUF835 domain-containing protein [Thermococcus sp.]
MLGYSIFVILEIFLVLSLDLLAAILVFRAYLRTKRKSALIFSVAWLSDFLTILSAGFNIYELNSFFIALFGALITYGILVFLEEEKESITLRQMRKAAILPPLFVVYLVLLRWYGGINDWTFIVGGSWFIAAVFLIFAGIFMKNLASIYEKSAKHLYYGFTLFGLHLLPYPFFAREQWYAPIGLTASTILIILLTTTMIRLVSSPRFTKLYEIAKETEGKKIDIKPGVLIVNQKEYRELKEKLKDTPALAFLRDISNVPEKWEYFFVTTALKDGAQNAVSPTDLAKITELTYRYLKTAADTNTPGIIIIDCLEYLLVYNDLSTVMKFLTKLRDFVLVNKGTLILVAERSALGDKNWALLTKLLG